jgi:uncharacterized membrane protein YqgA involved in biofilm formation
MILTGTLVNAAAVIGGSLIGLAFHAKIPTRFTKTIFQGIALFTILLGVNMGLKSNAFLLIVFSLIIGGFLGELLQLETKIEKVSEFFKHRIKSKNAKFTEGLTTSFLLFCMGSMTILGSFEEGLGKAPNLLMAKSTMDGFSSIALAASLGIGVLFSAIPLLIYQSMLTLFADFLSNYLNQLVIDNLTSVGGILLIGLGINLLEIKKIKIMNLLPALLFIILFSLL